MDKGMTQKDLAQKVNEKPSVIQDYESSKAIPNPQILGKLERALGVKLRGKLPSCFRHVGYTNVCHRVRYWEETGRAEEIVNDSRRIERFRCLLLLLEAY